MLAHKFFRRTRAWKTEHSNLSPMSLRYIRKSHCSLIEQNVEKREETHDLNASIEHTCIRNILPWRFMHTFTSIHRIPNLFSAHTFHRSTTTGSKRMALPLWKQQVRMYVLVTAFQRVESEKNLGRQLFKVLVYSWRNETEIKKISS